MFAFNELLVIGIGFWVLVLFIALRALRPKRNGKTIPVRERVGSAIALFVCLALALNGISWVSSWMVHVSNWSESKYESGVYPTESFGLTPGESYPMSLGQLGFNSKIDVTRTPFYFSYQEQSGSTVIVSVTHEDQTYILEIPVSETTYYQVEGVEPSMKLFFNTGVARVGSTMGQMEATRTNTYEPCRSVFTNFFWSCIRGDPISSVEVVETLTQSQIERGLSYWVINYLKRAEITLTPEMHDELIGKIG